MTIGRRRFLFSLGSAPAAQALPPASPKMLLVVAHPDDEYTFAGVAYRAAKELGGVVDQVVITNGEAGFRYSQLAESYYHLKLTSESNGRARLPEIRRRETIAAGRILGIRRHHFLGEKDTRFGLDAADALAAWNTRAVTGWLASLLARERYEFVFCLLPSADTHGHHKAAALLTLDAVERLQKEQRPAVLGSEPARAASALRPYHGLDGYPATEPWPGAPVYRFDRNARFGFRNSLNYQIVVNWVIAEHKSQGLFQTQCNSFDEERFWLLRGSGPDSASRAGALFIRLPKAA